MKNKQSALIIFLLIQLYLYSMLICFSKYFNPRILLIISSLLCVIMTGFLFCKTKDYYIMLIAISLSFISDLFIENIPVVSFFILNITQILYLCRTLLDSENKTFNITTRLVAIPICIFIGFMLLQDRMDLLAILWIIYTVNLFINILFAIKEIGLNNFFPIGLLGLFIYSSLTMFLALEDYTIVNVPFINSLANIPFNISLAFYIPAQIILTCSVFTVNRRCFSKIKNEEN